MNKIHRLIFAIAILLTTLGVHAADYKIEAINISGNGTLTAKMGSTDIAVNSTDIAYNALVTLTVTPENGYYLQSLKYEEVTSLGGAQAPRRRLGFQPIHNIDLLHAETHFGGDYTFYMPNNNIIVTASFAQLSTFSEPLSTEITFSLSGTPVTFDGYNHPLMVWDGSTLLYEGVDYQITTMTRNDVSTGDDHSFRSAGNYKVTITGIGRYQSTKTSDALPIAYKDLTITAKNQSYTYSYGGAISQGTSQVTVSGLVDNDALTGITLTQSTYDATGETPGTITPSAAVTSYGATNYAITYNTGPLFINPLAVGETSTGTKAVVTLTGPSSDDYGLYYNENGSEQVPTVAVTHTTCLSALVLGMDYTLTFTRAFNTAATDKKTADIYTITVTFQNNYSGTLTAEYQIRKQITLDNNHRWVTFFDQWCNMEVLPDNSATPQDFQAYSVYSVNTDAVVLELRDVIKANTPMLLYRRGDANHYQFTPPLVKNSDTRLSGWYLCEYYKRKATDWYLDSDPPAADKNIWILVNDQFVRTKSGTLSANRCYLELPSSYYTVPMLALETRPTGIEIPQGVLNNLESAAWYTIDGHRLQGMPTQKGIYITNGKKLVIK